MTLTLPTEREKQGRIMRFRFKERVLEFARDKSLGPGVAYALAECELCTFHHGNAYAIQWLGSQNLRIQDDDACVTMAVRCAGRALEFASHRLRAKVGICVEAVRQDRTAIEFVARVVRREVVLATLPRLYRWALTRLRQQRAALVFAQVDRWLIRRERDGFSQSVKRQRVE